MDDMAPVKRNFIAGGAGVVLAFVLFGVFMQARDLGYGLFVIFPFIVGIELGLLMHRGIGSFFKVTIGAYLAFTVLSVVVLGEGSICLIIASPLLLPMVWFGAMLGLGLQVIIVDIRNRFFLIALLAIGNVAYSGWWVSNHDLATDPVHMVSTSLRIGAPPEAVWSALRSDRRYTKPPPLLFQWGLPAPKELASDSQLTIAGTQAKPNAADEIAPNYTWTISNPMGRITLRATRVVPRQELDFVFENTEFFPSPPPGRKPTDWVTMRDGSFTLHDNGDGTTTLTRTVRFQRHLFPGFYFGSVEEYAMDALNGYVLQTIAEVRE
jgi:uncharacterized protein YndB with AHSA1/START domain